jgi:predicted nucleic acid-binding protein
MKRKVRLYLDTSVISALFDQRNPERRSLTQAFLKESSSFEVLISDVTVAEIERTPDSKLRGKMRSVISGLAVVSSTDDVEWLAKKYVDAGAVPLAYSEDAYHIALAVLADADFLLSWNFRHIVRAKTRDAVRLVNSMN